MTYQQVNMFKGQLFDYIDQVYTTDSILSIDSMSVNVDKETIDKLIFTKQYREVEKDEN